MTRIAYLIAADQDEATRMKRQLAQAIDPPERYIYVTDRQAALGYQPTADDRVFISPAAYSALGDPRSVPGDVYVWLWSNVDDAMVNAGRQTVDFRWDYGPLPDMAVTTDVAAWLAS